MANKIFVFVDGANIFYAQKNSNFWINWEKVMEYIEKKHDGQIEGAFYYIGRHIPPIARAERYTKLLTNLGFTVRRKDIKTFTDDVTGKKVSKGNLDIEIAIEMIHTRPQYDTAILFSGDGDFERVIELVRDAGKNIYIYSEKTTLSNELKNSAGRHLVYFPELKEVEKTSK